MRFLNILVLATAVGMVGCESREEARRKQVANNLKQLRLAMEAYHQKDAEPDGNEEPDTSEEASATDSQQSDGTQDDPSR